MSKMNTEKRNPKIRKLFLNHETLRALTAAVVLLGAAHKAEARLVFWAVNAASCIPGDPAIQGNRYTIGAGSVFNSSTNTSLITLYCPMAPISWALGAVDLTTCVPNSLDVTYIDSDGTSTGTFVDAQIINMDESDGSIWTVATFLSDNFPDTTVTQHSVTFTGGFIFTPSAYVRIDMQRSSTSQNSQIYQVAISGTGPGC